MKPNPIQQPNQNMHTFKSRLAAGPDGMGGAPNTSDTQDSFKGAARGRNASTESEDKNESTDDQAHSWRGRFTRAQSSVLNTVRANPKTSVAVAVAGLGAAVLATQYLRGGKAKKKSSIIERVASATSLVGDKLTSNGRGKKADSSAKTTVSASKKSPSRKKKTSKKD